jgi:cytochrome c553
MTDDAQFIDRANANATGGVAVLRVLLSHFALILCSLFGLGIGNWARAGDDGSNSGAAIADTAIAENAIPETISFNKHVRSILSENCNFCHGPDANHREADLRLDLAGSADHVIDVDDPAASILIERILEEDPDLQMPPPESGRTITKRQRKILTRWIEQGAAYEPHWAYVAPARPEIPKTRDTDWPNNAIDSFILLALEAKAIKPSKRAPPHVIVRRMHLDLIGLPPTPDEVQSFCRSYQSDADAAIEALADRLLASPHYGERMALPWLDAARYSDSNGFQQDGDRSQWPWRDWVVDALNENMPFDQFTIEQLAGDLLPDATEQQLIATGFNRNHMLNGEGGAIAEEQRNNYVFDRVDTTATTWLGLTMACAQCHDHKYDPITQKDYYRFFAYFNNVDENGNVDRRTGRMQCAKPFIELSTDLQKRQLDDVEAQLKPVREELAGLDEEIRAAMKEWEKAALKDIPKDIKRNDLNILKRPPEKRSPGEIKNLKKYFLTNFAKEPWKQAQKNLNELEKKKTDIRAKITTVMVMRERKQKRKTHLFQRGEYQNVGAEVQRGVPKFLPPSEDIEVKDRLALARRLVSPTNPLTSRVTVNRYWQTFFGMGLVKTSEDFGVQGEQPSHLDLLDWLAVDFWENHWDAKRMVRMIVTSETYLQSSRFRSGGDPVLYLSNPDGMPRALRRKMLDHLNVLNQEKLADYDDPEIETRIAQYELAYRMQMSLPEITDISDEPQHVLEMYCPDVHRTGSFARNCLLARKLAEKDVRFIQLMHIGWDQHANIPTQLLHQCKDTDQPAAALVKDLKQRGLLEDTLVIFGGEFGRTVFGQGNINNEKRYGRDHHGRVFSLWMAGGGVKPGFEYGQSCDYGWNVAENGVHVHDWQATVMHMMGINHELLTYRYQGRRFRLTDVHGHVVKDLLV